MIFNNIEYCGVYRMVDNYYNYCMNNWKDCMYHINMADRIYDHILELISIGMEEFRMIHKHKDCATDVELLADVAETVEKFAEFKKIIHGFEGTWDQSKKVEDHLTFKQMYHNYHTFKMEHYNDFKHECPMKKLWKKFMGDITPEDVFGDLFAMLPPFPKLQIPHGFHPIPHHAPAHHQSWGFPSHMEFQMPMMQMPMMQVPEMQMRSPFESMTMWAPQPVHHQTPAWPFMHMPQMPMPQMQMPQMHMPHLF